MAVDMSAEISDQNEQLDRITIKVGSNPIFILWWQGTAVLQLNWELYLWENTFFNITDPDPE